jgi:hypothetical protein
VSPELKEIHKRCERMAPGHILTGPIAVVGARPEQTLEVRILDVALRQDWGYNLIVPLMGALPEDFATARCVNIPLDVERKIARTSRGLELPLHPFFGVMGVAPPRSWDRITSLIPRCHAGNLDNKERVAPGRRSLCRSSSRARSSLAATATASRATAKSASRPSKPPCKGRSNSSCATIFLSPIRARRRRAITSRWR